MKTLSLALISIFTTAGLFAAEPAASTASHYAAAKTLTLQGKLEAADRYQQTDFTRFVAGDGYFVSEVDGSSVSGQNATLKGIACFDLNQEGMRAALTNPGQNHIILSFILMQIKGKPRPLRVEYVGTFDDLSQKEDLTRIFEAQPITEANQSVEQGSKNGLHMVDLTALSSHSLPKRWLVIRFEQQGLRIENTGQDDLYQFNATADTVRLTLSDKDAAGKSVSDHYTASGYYNLLSDEPKNLLSDEPKDLTSDMPKDLTSDMPKDLTSDMPSNLIQDEPSNLIDDAGN